MKKTASIVLLSLYLISSWQCTRDKNFTVSGQLLGIKNDTIRLEEMGDKGIVALSTIIPDENGFFTFTDTAENPRFLLLKINGSYISLLVLNGQEIKISADIADINGSFSVEGSHESELIWELNKEMQAATIKLDSLSRIYESQQANGGGPDAETWIQRKFQELLNQQKDFITRFINDHYDSPACLMALSHQVGRQAILNPATDFAYFAKVDSALSIKYPESTMVATLHNWVLGQQQQRSINASQQNTVGIGAEAPDIKIPNPDGKIIALSSLRGKYVLLDFWAAWCSPCRRENPNLVRAYNKYNQKGLEIYQVSLDKTREDWIRAIETDRLNWTHVSDLKYWGSPVAKLYFVRSIPANFLIDPDGKIIATNLRGTALDNKLSEIFDK